MASVWVFSYTMWQNSIWNRLKISVMLLLYHFHYAKYNGTFPHTDCNRWDLSQINLNLENKFLHCDTHFYVWLHPMTLGNPGVCIIALPVHFCLYNDIPISKKLRLWLFTLFKIWLLLLCAATPLHAAVQSRQLWFLIVTSDKASFYECRHTLWIKVISSVF